MNAPPDRPPAPPAAPLSPPSATAAEDFETLLLPLLGPLFGAALRLTRNRADAEDLVQDATLLAFRAFRTFQSGTNFKAWVFRILMNCFYSKGRRRRGERTTFQLEDATELYVYLRSGEVGLRPQFSDPAQSAIAHMESEQVAAALEMLPEEYRVVSTLYFLEDFSYQEIADVLAIPVGTVRSRLHRGRRMLQKRLWQIAEDLGIVPGSTAGVRGGGAE